METIEQYFARTDSPAAGSPIGVLMRRIVAKFPQMAFEQARAKAQGLLSRAARSFDYRTPPVRSAEGEAARKAAFAQLNAKRREVVAVATPSRCTSVDPQPVNELSVPQSGQFVDRI